MLVDMTEPDPVARARAALARAETLTEQYREALAVAIVAAVRSGEKISRVSIRAGYTREHVRRMVRARGVGPSQVRQPPPGRRPVVAA